MPAIRIATMRSEVATGRRMNSLERFTRSAARDSFRAFFAPSFFRGRVGRGLVEVRPLPELDLRPLAQAVDAVDHHALAGLEAGVDRGEGPVGGADLHRPHGDGAVVLDDVDEQALRAAL